MASTPQGAAQPNPGLIFETLNAHQRPAALRAAIELDLFRAIGEGPGDVQSLAEKCSASERGIRILCDYLTILGLSLIHILTLPTSDLVQISVVAVSLIKKDT